MDLTLRLFSRWTTEGVAGLLTLAMVGGVAQSSWAQDNSFVAAQPFLYEVSYSDWKDCGLRKGNVNAFVVHRPDSEKQRAKTASIRVEYGPNVPPAARSAYERAVDIWERHIETEIEIRIAAGAIEDPEEGTLGGTIPTQFWILEDANGPEVIAGDALADVLTGQDLSPDSTDMLTDFNFERSDWHFGEGPAPAGMVDFTTVVLHEIAHGLHYLSLCRKALGGGQCRFGVGDGVEVADAYSEQLREQRPGGALRALTREDAYESSESLGQALTSDRLVFVGERAETGARRSTGPVPPKIYAPGSYHEGSSLSHVDEFTYPFEGTNALMTPFVQPAETNRRPGPVVCGQLAAVGWPLGVDCKQHFQDVFNVRFAAGTESVPESVTLNWSQSAQADIEEFIIEQRYFDGAFAVVKRGIEAPPVTLDSLGLGQFAFRVRWVRSDGTQGVSVRNLERTVRLRNLTAEVVEQDERGRGTVEVSWEVPSGTPTTFSFHVERANGGNSQFSPVGEAPKPRFTAEGRLPGRYSYRVVSRDKEGHSLVSTEAPLRIPFDGPVYANGPFPNPVRTQSTLVLTARQFQDTTVEVFNAIGERVYRRRRAIGQQEPVRFTFDSREWASGLYFVRIQGRRFTMTRKMVVVH